MGNSQSVRPGNITGGRRRRQARPWEKPDYVQGEIGKGRRQGLQLGGGLLLGFGSRVNTLGCRGIAEAALVTGERPVVNF
jgi:hypothetical protein